jgi:chromate transporter
VLLLGVLYTRFGDNAQMAGALRGMALSAGMIAATGVKLAAALGKHPLPLWLTLPSSCWAC